MTTFEKIARFAKKAGVTFTVAEIRDLAIAYDAEEKASSRIRTLALKGDSDVREYDFNVARLAAIRENTLPPPTPDAIAAAKAASGNGNQPVSVLDVIRASTAQNNAANAAAAKT